MQRRKVWILVSIPAFILAVLLVVAEVANQLIVNVLVSGVRHPLWGVYELALTLMAVGAMPFFALLWLRHLPRQPGDGFFDPFYRWLREGAAEEARRREARWSKESARGRAGRFAVLAVGILALLAALVLTRLPNPRSTPRPRGHTSAAASRIGSCAPAPCAVLATGTLLVTAIANHYVPTDLPKSARGFSDDGAAPFGERYVRVEVRFLARRNEPAPALRRVLRLDDGTALRRPTALSFDPGCRALPPAPARRRGIPLCFVAHGAHRGPLSLVWRAAHLHLHL